MLLSADRQKLLGITEELYRRLHKSQELQRKLPDTSAIITDLEESGIDNRYTSINKHRYCYCQCKTSQTHKPNYHKMGYSTW